MKATTHSARRKVLAMSPLALLLLAPAVGAAEREQIGDQQTPQIEVSQATQEINPSNRAGVPSGLGIAAQTPSGPVRRVTPDPKRQQQLTGEVVNLENRTLFVKGDGGQVVPFDVSALQFHKQPEEGQEVRVTYQVEGGTDNVAVGLEGAKQVR